MGVMPFMSTLIPPYTLSKLFSSLYFNGRKIPIWSPDRKSSRKGDFSWFFISPLHESSRKEISDAVYTCVFGEAGGGKRTIPHSFKKVY